MQTSGIALYSTYPQLERLEQRKTELESALDRQQVWGDASPEQLANLSELDVHVQCWISRVREAVAALGGSDVQVFELERRARGEIVFCTINSGEPVALDHARNITLPVALRADLEHRRDETRAKISTVGGAIGWIAKNRFGELAGQIADAHDALKLEEVRSGIHLDDHVFVLSGWVPETRLADVRETMATMDGVTARFRDPLPRKSRRR